MADTKDPLKLIDEFTPDPNNPEHIAILGEAVATGMRKRGEAAELRRRDGVTEPIWYSLGSAASHRRHQPKRTQ